MKNLLRKLLKFNTFTYCRLPFWLRPSWAPTCCWSLTSLLAAAKSPHAAVLSGSVGSFDELNVDRRQTRLLAAEERRLSLR